MMEFLNLEKFFMKKLKEQGVSEYDCKFRFDKDALELTIKSAKIDNMFDIFAKILSDLELKYCVEDNSIILDKESFIKFQNKIIENAETKWIIEEVSGNYPYICASDGSSIEFDVYKYYYDDEIDAMIAYYNLTEQRAQDSTHAVYLAPKKILYFDI